MLRDGMYLVPLHWRGAPTPGPARRVAWVVRAGWLESPRNRTLSPLSSRAKRGDPVNKKALRANARRHIALDCHSRTPTFSTLIILLRNDSGGVASYSCHPSPGLRAISPPRRTKCDPPRPRIHPRKLCLRGTRCGAVGIRPPRRFAAPLRRGELRPRRDGSSTPICRRGELCSATGRGHWGVRVMGMLPKNGGGVFVFLPMQCKSTNRQLITIDKLSSNGLEWRMYWCQFPMLMFRIVIYNGLSHLPHLGCNNWSGT